MGAVPQSIPLKEDTLGTDHISVVGLVIQILVFVVGIIALGITILSKIDGRFDKWGEKVDASFKAVWDDQGRQDKDIGSLSRQYWYLRGRYDVAKGVPPPPEMGGEGP